ncbi:hypothetical protein MPH_06716 [Macrophomina phaseolina MS6]|uniref:Uncharacterized protein n=1 Tax=Macrophomina phaseolina (strain MS6) TaxID=1126212 RepID=K2RTK8_MACPH|nr:hypothetical protein MPH_06716 [Macrophomina phaseolina MS6]
MPMKAPNAKNIMITASGTDILGETWTIRSAMFCACNGNPSFSEEDRRQSCVQKVANLLLFTFFLTRKCKKIVEDVMTRVRALLRVAPNVSVMLSCQKSGRCVKNALKERFLFWAESAHSDSSCCPAGTEDSRRL